ncbi:Protein CBG25704 [Caenorhabditis briggsae]|uniref:Protein CBG25704 n=1 Tax=Caenorhabditis briggsae TaxID=6238 RepID=B6IGW7_CAEBR|nr:Protein CBG25704 [Caenorhabditis briggsae]CAR99147.1 Protein CBG25704 [Caenorhabditis briggsae]
MFPNTSVWMMREKKIIRTLESSRRAIDSQRDAPMLPKTNLVKYLAAYQQQLLAVSGINLPPAMLPKIPPTSPKSVEGVPDFQRRLWAACRCTNTRLYQNGNPMFGSKFLFNKFNGGFPMKVEKCPIDGFRFYKMNFEGSQKDAQEYWRALTRDRKRIWKSRAVEVRDEQVKQLLIGIIRIG